MSTPRIEIVPARPAVRADAPATLDVLVRVTPPLADATTARPPLNLGLVLDRSGSMGERNKITFAREAAAFAVRELAAADRVSVTIFDDRVETIAPGRPAGDKTRLLELINGIQPRGSTALHGGWAEGAAQVAGGLVPGGLNRVLILSDGLANVGETRPDTIATDVHRKARDGVSTSTLGLGDEYNEDLLEAMARSGDGNYYYVESPAQLPGIFGAELRGLTATVGTDATLTVRPAAGVTVADVLNDLDPAGDGRFRLPNLVAGLPILVVVRLNVPAGTGDRGVCRFRVEWTPPDGRRQSAEPGLALPSVPGSVWDALANTAEVQERAVLLLVARCKKAATRASGLGQAEEARRWLAEAKRLLATAPVTAEVNREAEALARITHLVESGQEAKFRKRAKYESYQRGQSRPML